MRSAQTGPRARDRSSSGWHNREVIRVGHLPRDTETVPLRRGRHTPTPLRSAGDSACLSLGSTKRNRQRLHARKPPRPAFWDHRNLGPPNREALRRRLRLESFGTRHSSLGGRRIRTNRPTRDELVSRRPFRFRIPPRTIAREYEPSQVR